MIQTPAKLLDVQRVAQKKWVPQTDGTVYWIARDPDGWPVWFFEVPGKEQETAAETLAGLLVQEKKQAHARTMELYQGVAAHLDGWTVDCTQFDSGNSWSGPDLRYKIINGKGHAISLSRGRGSDRGKIHISGYWPVKGEGGHRWTSPHDVRESSPDIGVSESRGYEAIAREIQRRFLPEYLRIYTKIEAKITEELIYESRKARGWQGLVDAGLVVNPRERNGEQAGDLRIGSKDADGGYNYDKGYGDIRMTSADTVEIHLRSLPLETAEHVLEALRGGENG